MQFTMFSSILLLLISTAAGSQEVSVGAMLQDIAETTQTGIAASASGEETALAVYHFTADGERTHLGDFLSSELSSYLALNLKSGAKVLSREKMDELFQEHQFQMSDMTDGSTAAAVGKKLSAQFIVTGFIFAAGDTVRINFQLINVESGEILAGKSYRLKPDDEIRGFLAMSDGTAEDAAEPEEEIIIPEYVFEDPFLAINRDVWKSERRDGGIVTETTDDFFRIEASGRTGVNGISLYSHDLRAASFAVEISFRDPRLNSNWISLTMSNVSWANGGASFQVRANMYDGYYIFRWNNREDDGWLEDEDNMLYELFEDEDTEFHRLKLVYDLKKKRAYGFIDDILLSVADDFQFNRTDRIQIIVSVNSDEKDFTVDLKGLKSSFALD